MGKAMLEVDTTQLRTLVTQAKGQLETLENTLNQIEEAARNVPVTVANEEPTP